MEFREEQPRDRDAVRAVVDAAFGRPDEGAIVDALRAADAVVLSMVADERGAIVGHVLFSPVEVGSVAGAVALAPMAVAPGRQREGIGTALVERALGALRERGAASVFVLGHPDYYPRFGFAPASRFGVGCPLPAPDAAFLALELVAGALRGARGVLRYHPALA